MHMQQQSGTTQVPPAAPWYPQGHKMRWTRTLLGIIRAQFLVRAVPDSRLNISVERGRGALGAPRGAQAARIRLRCCCMAFFSRSRIFLAPAACSAALASAAAFSAASSAALASSSSCLARAAWAFSCFRRSLHGRPQPAG